MQVLQLDKIRSVLCLGAHPDDIEIGCGATIKQLCDRRPDVRVDWIVFSGDELRREEASQSAKAWLASVKTYNIVVHDFRDGFFPSQYEAIKNAIHETSRDVNPDVVFTHRLEDRHQDHRLLAEISWNAFRKQLILEYEIPKYEGDLGHPNVYSPLSEEEVRIKINRLIQYFPSQICKPWFDEMLFTAQMRLRGIESASMSKFAEAFHVRKCVIGW